MIDEGFSGGGGRGAGLGIGASRFFLPFVAFLVMVFAAILAANVISSDSSNPVAVLLLISGICLGFYAQMRPWGALLTFLWLAVTIDTAKRLTFATSSMSMVDVAYILAVPVIMMASLYLRVLLLQWFAPDPSIDKLQIKKFVPVILLMGLITAAVLAKDGLSFSNLSKSYNLICYIPAAVVIPLMLSSPERWHKFSQHLYWIAMVIGVYGLIQAWHGPFNFEYVYLLSGLTATDSLLEDGRFRVFSLLSASSTFAGTMVIATFYALYNYCLPYGRLQLRGWKTKALVVFCFVVCAFATQRGALFCGLITVLMLPLFSRPKLLQAAFAIFVGFFVLMIVNMERVWDFITWLDEAIEPIRFNAFMQMNTHLLTFGARKDSFEALHEASTWTPFGLRGADIMSAHDLVTQLVLMIGWVGMLIFVGLLAGLLAISSRLLENLKHSPTAYLWAQVNMAVFTFVIVWGLLLGSSIHVSPINFFFWFSVGNLLYLQGNKRVEEVSKQEPRLILPILPEKGVALTTRPA